VQTANAKSYGVRGVGAITEPKDLSEPLRDAIKVVKRGGGGVYLG
jgi:hypothetical protein